MPVGLHPNTSGLGTIETHVPTVWEYLWHFGGRPKCFFLKRSALILRKHMSIIRKRIAHMFHAQGPSAKMVTGQVRNLTSRLPRARGYSAIYIAMQISPRRSDRTGSAVKLAAPTVANCKVYVGTRGNNTGGTTSSITIPGELDVYGLLPN